MAPTSEDIQALAKRLKPYVLGWIQTVTQSAGGTGFAPSPHALNSPHHSGELADSQGPNFLLRDGSRSLLGNMAVGAGVTIDDVDIDVFKAAYDVHIANPDAHHQRFIGVIDDSGMTRSPNASGFLTVQGGAGIVSSGAANVVSLALETPSTLSVSSTNAAGNGHTHAISSSSAPGVAASLLATNAQGGFTLSGLLTGVGDPAIAVRQPGDTQPRLQVGNTGRLGFGPGDDVLDVILRRTGARELTLDDGAAGPATAVVTGGLNVGRTDDGPGLLNVRGSGEQVRLEYDSGNYASFTVGAGGNLTVRPTGDLVLDPAGNDVLPAAAYDLNLGALNRKYLTLHAAELWVETLVAQNTLATIGGRVLIGPTTTLTSDVPTATRTYTAPSVQGTASNSGVGSSITTVLPGAPQVGDTVVYHVGVNSSLVGYSIGLPTGWTLIRTDNNSGNTRSHFICYKVFESGDVAPTITLGTSQAYLWEALLLRGTWEALPVHANAGQPNASSTTITAPGITTLYPNTRVVFFGLTAASTTCTPPTFYTEHADVNNGGSMTLTMASLVYPSPTATGNQSATGGSVGANAGALVAFSPAITTTGSITVKHNQMSVGDVVYLEANGSLEFMRVTAGPTGSGPYTYNMARDLDGTGTNAWAAGDAVFNTGQAGNGFIDLYSLAGVYGNALDYVHNFNLTSGGSPWETGTFSGNYALSRSWTPFGDGANTAIGDAIYFGNEGTAWSNIYFTITTAAVYTATPVWEYWNGTAWQQFFPTVKLDGLATATELFEAAGSWSVEWPGGSLPSWVPKTLNSVSAWWVRLRISSYTSFTTLPVQSKHWVYWKQRNTGPAAAMNVRNSSTFNDWSTHAAFGNLNGLYDYGTDVYGFAAGKWSGPGGTTPWIAADATNGFRVMRGSTKLAQWDTAGAITVGQVGVGQSNVFINAGQVQLRNNTTPAITLRSAPASDGTIATFDGFIGLSAAGGIYQGTGTASAPTTGLKISRSGSVGKLSTYSSGVEQVTLDTDGVLKAGAGLVRLDSSGMTIDAGTDPRNKIKFRSGSITNAELFGGGGAASSMFARVYAPTAGAGATLDIGAVDSGEGTGLSMLIWLNNIGNTDKVRVQGTHPCLVVGNPGVYDAAGVGVWTSGDFGTTHGSFFTTNGNIQTTNGHLFANQARANTFLSNFLTGVVGVSPGGASLGHLGLDYVPNSGGDWAANTLLLLNFGNQGGIGFHDHANRVDFIHAGSGVLTVGYNAGWGAASIAMPGRVGVGMGNGGVPTTTTMNVRALTNSAAENAFQVQNSTPANLLWVRADGADNRISSNWALISDLRLKDDVSPLDVDVDAFLELATQPIRYKLRLGNEARGPGLQGESYFYGYDADRVAAFAPDLVTVDADGYRSVRYGDFTPIHGWLIADLYRTVQEQAARIAALEARLDGGKP
jgi:hypothetical protein